MHSYDNSNGRHCILCIDSHLKLCVDSMFLSIDSSLWMNVKPSMDVETHAPKNIIGLSLT